MALPEITLRNTKGSALTFTEMDNNLTNLQTANIQITDGTTTSNVALNSAIEFDTNTLNLTVSGNVVTIDLSSNTLIADNANAFVGVTVVNGDDTGIGAGASIVLSDGGATPAVFLKAGQAYDNASDNLSPGDAALLNIGGIMSVGSATHATTIFAGGTQDANIVATFNTDGTVDFAGNIEATVNGFEIGYRNMPQVTASTTTLALADSGKHFYSTGSTAYTITIPANSSVEFPLGTVVTVVNQSTANVTIANGSTSLYLGGNATSASRTITSFGIGTLIKVATDTWFINGTGVV